MTEPGPVAEEAAKLFEALSSWAHSATGTAFEGVANAPECRLCPVCTLIRAMRSARPETYEHLLTAATSLVAALRSTIEAHEHDWAARREAPVERIDIS